MWRLFVRCLLEVKMSWLLWCHIRWSLSSLFFNTILVLSCRWAWSWTHCSCNFRSFQRSCNWWIVCWTSICSRDGSFRLGIDSTTTTLSLIFNFFLILRLSSFICSLSWNGDILFNLTWVLTMSWFGLNLLRTWSFLMFL